MYIYSPDRFSSHGLGKEALVATLLRWICRPSFELVIYTTWWADLQKRFVKLTNTWNLCILAGRGINFWDSEPPGAPWPPGVPDASQMPSMPPMQMPLRCLSDASQMPPRCAQCLIDTQVRSNMGPNIDIDKMHVHDVQGRVSIIWRSFGVTMSRRGTIKY